MNPRDLERLEQLLADRATEGLGDVELLELRGLLMRSDAVDADGWLIAAAAVDRAFASDATPSTLAPSLRSRIGRQSREHFRAVRARRPQAHPSESAPTPDDSSDLATSRAPRLTLPRDSASASTVPSRASLRFDFIGWAVAAAAILVAFIGWLPETEPEPHVALALLKELDPDTTESSWGSSDFESFRNVSGKVVWSERHQRGFMVIRGGPVNDPRVLQYQLWIVDAKRDENPVDGGVFDVTSSGEQIIPFHSRLPVEPSAFALTEEKPGGVVVSKGPLVLVAAVE